MPAQTLLDALSDLEPADADLLLKEVVTGNVGAILKSWPMTAMKGQLPPRRDGREFWRIWLLMAGRGFGKTRAGAEWVRGLAEQTRGMRIALVGATTADVRGVMVEGDSGILAVSGGNFRPLWEPSLGRLTWPNGAQAFVYSAEAPERLRGPQHHVAWCDETAKWSNALATWDNLQLGLRLARDAKTLITTTPRQCALLRTLVARADVVVTKGRTADNVFLPQGFVAAMTALYAGTRLGRQELDGELIDDVAGALWTRAMLDGCRAASAPPLKRVVIGVDPPISVGGDACGIIVVGLGEDGRGYVLADASVSGCSPEGWAQAVAHAAAKWNADRVIAEANQGGEMVGSVLRAANIALPVKLVHASRGKSARAEPVAALYEGGRVAHVGVFPALEDELCGLIAGGGYEGPGRSPDRADAAVWALWELMLARVKVPRVRGV